MSPRDDSPTAGEMFFDVLDLLGGLGIVVLPLFPFVLPALVLLLPLALLALPLAILAAPVLAIVALRRRRRAKREAGRRQPLKVDITPPRTAAVPHVSRR
jgi:membrane protein implicated in regulation of membrane protease activity